jgi:hypothetical protein
MLSKDLSETHVAFDCIVTYIVIFILLVAFAPGDWRPLRGGTRSIVIGICLAGAPRISQTPPQLSDNMGNALWKMN